ncbi:Em protein H5 [Platanthera guangdongensis]|uniref:Em protein H5 n=1 Tax=Platanthera guangdongensis TaxID=2320717 RepID=A0ABR2MJ86_9ASPA
MSGMMPYRKGTRRWEAEADRPGQSRKEQIGTEGYKEIGWMGVLTATEVFGGEQAVGEGVYINDSKFKKSSDEGS